jgi:hypothetical protein
MIKQVVVATVLGASTLVVAPPASADTPRCVNRSEFGSVRLGMMKHRVHAVFDTAGRRVSIATSSTGHYFSEIRTYRRCSRDSLFAVSWTKRPGGVWRMDAKWVG